ncbi:MAG: RNA-binding transcriptional accessory protein [Prevotella sp.]|nr:RNA-binding transcriptional accessory protein [Prevotella sp.]MCM1075535.1 RNA-binding transcriptional accessory protein [Ruminococcus sp.]
MEDIITVIARKLDIPVKFVTNTVELLDGGATVPFISRYRKESTGSMDEVKVESVLDLLLELKELQRRKEYILKTIEGQGKLTDELREKITASWDNIEVEDLYLPYKPKRRTKAEVARQRGLEPLAKIIMSQKRNLRDLTRFLNDEVPAEADAIQGASDIIAEWVSEDTRSRNTLRNLFARTAILTSAVVPGKEDEGIKYKDYFNFKEPLNRCSSHRLLAIMRGENEGVLRIDISPADYAIERLERLFVRTGHPCAEIVKAAVDDSYKRLLKPSIENEFAVIAKRDADNEAIEVFGANLRSLLLSPPLGARRLMAIDPGYRTGCKVVVLDKNGLLLHHETIYPHGKQDARVYAEMQVMKMVDRFDVSTIAIGSGTAGRETRDFINELELGVDIYMVNEDGASVYSASEAARREFPDKDVTVRGAVSIGRRLMDPLSELVKIDPKSIGVGQYQHDVDQKLLKKKLDSVTVSCVNTVGVNLNTAGSELLSYVSGLGPSLAENIISYKRAHGDFKDRKSLLKVPRLGAKAFEQCAGFLRIPGAKNPLDNSAVHPERYAVVEAMAGDLNCTTHTLITDPQKRKSINLTKYQSKGLGMETLTDILSELEKPGRDPRETLEQVAFDDTISSIEDIREGMELPGVVANVTNFGCFVDLGIKTKGLVHISQLSEKRVSNPHTIVKVQQKVRVRVLSVDVDRSRIALTMKGISQ